MYLCMYVDLDSGYICLGVSITCSPPLPDLEESSVREGGIMSTCHAQHIYNQAASQDGLLCSLIRCFVKQGEPRRALMLYKNIQEENPLPLTGSVFVALLKACSMVKDLEQGCALHADVSKKGLLERDAFVCSSLVDMYVKCSSLTKAQAVFDKLPVRDVVLWTALISGYAECGRGEKALKCVDQMRCEKVSPNAYTLVSCLKACSSIGAIVQGEEFYSEIVGKGLEREVPVGNTLVDMYSKFGLLGIAQHILNNLPIRDKVSWTALITAHAEQGYAEEVLHYVNQMQDEGVPPDAFTYVSSLKACGSIGAIIKGQVVHNEVAQKGLERELLVGNILVDMYAKCGAFADAQTVFDKLPIRNAVPFTALIIEYAEQGQGAEGLDCYDRMLAEGVCPDVATLVCGLKACSSIEAMERGQDIHAEIFIKGLEKEPLVGNTLVDMYVKCGLFTEAQNVFDNLSFHDVVSWTALIAGYIEHGHGEEALFCLEQMQERCIPMNVVTFVCSAKACSSVGATYKGQDLHREIFAKGLEGELVGNILVDMYVNFGLLPDAQHVFDKLQVRDTISWNALITGYGQLGQSGNVFIILDRMIEECIQPDRVTFISVLNACSHAGLMNEGELYFEAISNTFGFIPTLEHHTCLVDILGRAGLVDKAIAAIEDMPFHPDIVLWHTVLGACQKWSDVELGRHAFEHAVWLNEKDGAAYVCMSNIYSGADMHEEAIKVEAMRVEKQAW